MARTFTVDTAIGSRLDRAVLADLRRHLWPIDCPGCGRGFGAFARPALRVVAHPDGTSVQAGLYHRRCRGEPWRTRQVLEIDGRPTVVMDGEDRSSVSWRAAIVELEQPTFVVNPSCEMAFLRTDGTDGTGPTRVATLDLHVAHGGLSTHGTLAPSAPTLAARLEPGRLRVGFRGTDGELIESWSWWGHAPEREPLVRAIHDRGVVLVAFSTALRPGSLRVPDVAAAIDRGEVAFGYAELHRDRSVQTLPADGLGDPELRVAVIESFAAGLVGRDAPEVPAVRAACAGDPGPLRALDGDRRDRALALVATLYSAASVTADDGAILPYEGVHVVTADPTALAHQWSHVVDGAPFGPVEVLGPDAGGPDPAYDGHVVAGTIEQLTVAAGTAPVRRGRLAIVLDGDLDAPVLRTYRAVLAL